MHEHIPVSIIPEDLIRKTTQPYFEDQPLFRARNEKHFFMTGEVEPGFDSQSRLPRINRSELAPILELGDGLVDDMWTLYRHIWEVSPDHVGYLPFDEFFEHLHHSPNTFNLIPRGHIDQIIERNRDLVLRSKTDYTAYVGFGYPEVIKYLSENLQGRELKQFIDARSWVHHHFLEQLPLVSQYNHLRIHRVNETKSHTKEVYYLWGIQKNSVT